MNEKYKRLSLYYRDLWWKSSCDLQLTMTKYTLEEKQRREKDFDVLIDKIIKYIESFPKDEKKRESWRIKGNNYIEKIISSERIFKLGVIDKEMKSAFIKSTKDFIKASKSFDSTLSYEDIGQAMRNVWIVNMLQQAFGETIRFNNGVFGYSMLYPYTDNYLDNIEIGLEEKISFNKRFTKRLNGEKVMPLNKHEDKVYNLVSCIESEFKREKFNGVYDSLLLIQEGQKLSLNQQEEESIPYEKDILGISIDKGGASVIADGNLIRGTMSEEEERFAWGYGFLLQLGDDLQDIKADKEKKHMTIMSQLAGKYHLDKIVNKLINLTIYVADNAKCFVCKNPNELKELIKNNCNYMVLFAIIDNKEYFSKEYINEINNYLPFTIEFCGGIKQKINDKFKKLKKEYHGVSVEDILMEFCM